MARPRELVLFSRVDGVVLKDGAPLAGVEILQEIVYREPGRVPSRTITTDASGRFSLSPVTERSGLGRLVPGQPSILQRLVIRHDGVEYEGWRHSKESFEANSELDGRPLRLVCDLSTAPDFEGKHYGVCRVAPD